MEDNGVSMIRQFYCMQNSGNNNLRAEPLDQGGINQFDYNCSNNYRQDRFPGLGGGGGAGGADPAGAAAGGQQVQQQEVSRCSSRRSAAVPMLCSGGYSSSGGVLQTLEATKELTLSSNPHA